MLPPPPVLAPPLGAAPTAALDDASGAGAVGVAVTEVGDGTGAGLEAGGLDGAAGLEGGAGLDAGGLEGGGLDAGGLDDVGVGVGVVQVGVGVGFGLPWWRQLPAGDGDGDEL